MAARSDSGDDCHYNLTGIDEKASTKFMKNKRVVLGAPFEVNPQLILICSDENVATRATAEVLKKLREKWVQDSIKLHKQTG